MAEVMVVIHPIISWGAPYRFWLVPLLVGLLVIVLWQQIQSWGVMHKLAAQSRFFEQFKHFRWWRARTMLVCYLLALLVLAFAMLEPQWGEREEVVPQEGRDIMFALDISR